MNDISMLLGVNLFVVVLVILVILPDIRRRQGELRGD